MANVATSQAGARNGTSITGESDIKPDYEVRFESDGHDPYNPKTWSRPYRWYLTSLSGALVLAATFASSAPVGIIPNLAEQFSMSSEVATLTIALFVAGYSVGPILWGPLSEHVGRRPVFLYTFIVFTAFQLGCALSPNTAAMLVFRFLSGIFAAAPLANSGAVVADIWDAKTRGKAVTIFTLAPFAGPSLGPLISGFIAASGTSWRWLFWVLTIFSGVCLVLVAFTFSETYPPVLLARKACVLRKQTGDAKYWAPLEKQQISLAQLSQRILGRPFLMLAFEPMLLAMTIYQAFVYGCVYLLFDAYPIVFMELHLLGPAVSGLTYIPLLIGAMLGAVLYLVIFIPRYDRLAKACAPASAPPESRLEVCIYAAPLFALSFFWFGWTSYADVSVWAPMMAGLPLALATVWIFLGLFNYIIDVYLLFAASALSVATIVRALFGAAFPLFGNQMYKALNPRWASTLVGLIAVLLCPIPFVLAKFGPALRERSRYSPTAITHSRKSVEATRA